MDHLTLGEYEITGIGLLLYIEALLSFVADLETGGDQVSCFSEEFGGFKVTVLSIESE